jgi:aspartate/methionine/tyrosine aminotransferase
VAAGKSEIDLALGEPCEPPPLFLAASLEEAGAQFGRYPPVLGSATLQRAIREWLRRRYGISERAAARLGVIPLSGSREGLLYSVLTAIGRRSQAGRAAVLMPNPSYAAYQAAALAANSEPVGLTAGRAGLPDLDLLGQDRELLARTALLILCSPSNPEGYVADAAYLASAIALARAHGFTLLVDEAYSEIYDETPPPGALEIAAAQSERFDSVVVLNSLSKRSSVPGLRSGFCAGDAAFVEDLGRLRNILGPQMPGPIQHASAAIWSDEAHVVRSRAVYRRRWDLAERLLGPAWGLTRPAGGFFAWLDVAPLSGEQAALLAWREQGVRLLPGGYLTFGDDDGGAGRVRLALVKDEAMLEEALGRLDGMIRPSAGGQLLGGARS